MSLWNSILIAAMVAACDSPDDEALLERLDEAEAGNEAQRELTRGDATEAEERAGAEDLLAEAEPDPEKLDIDDELPMELGGAVDPLLGLENGQVKVFNLCQSLSLYQYNPAYHGTEGNPAEGVGNGKKLIWQTLSGTPNGWATVLSAGQEYWGWRYARVECLGGSW
ncbi:hypothetical protein OV090_06225 [Nannocystis sp. RBIL2]|nr:hypothetical protein [Nannocystis sp. RBIL2]MCY1064347.1 hypothetical protein [Nannocystis sp. RBIL2]